MYRLNKDAIKIEQWQIYTNKKRIALDKCLIL